MNQRDNCDNHANMWHVRMNAQGQFYVEIAGPFSAGTTQRGVNDGVDHVVSLRRRAKKIAVNIDGVPDVSFDAPADLMKLPALQVKDDPCGDTTALVGIIDHLCISRP